MGGGVSRPAPRTSQSRSTSHHQVGVQSTSRHQRWMHLSVVCQLFILSVNEETYLLVINQSMAMSVSLHFLIAH